MVITTSFFSDCDSFFLRLSCHACFAGCISAVVLVRSWTADTAALLSFRDRTAADPAFAAQRRSLTFHLAVTSDTAYPVNSLRNIALDQVSTSHVRSFLGGNFPRSPIHPQVFLVDADFITSVGARAALVERLRHIQGQRKVLVVPAFDVASGGKEVPRDKQHLRNSGAVAVQLAKSECAHKATQYNRWWSQTEPFVITAAEWDKEDFCYEPYFVAPVGIAKFDQRCADRPCYRVPARLVCAAPEPFVHGVVGLLRMVATKLRKHSRSGLTALSLKFSRLFLWCMCSTSTPSGVLSEFRFELFGLQIVCPLRIVVKGNAVDISYNWTRAWLNIMFFRASMDALHGTSSTALADWPRSECQLRPPPSTAAAPVNALFPRSNRVVPQYGVKFEPFVLRPNNKILVQDGSSRDSSSTMLIVCRLIS